MKRIIPKYKNCENCKEEYLPLSALSKPLGEKSINWKNRKYCSKSCAMKVNRGKKPTVLGKNWKIKNTSKMKGHHPKSEFKKGLKSWNTGMKGFRAGKKSHLWKGGVTPLNQQIRSSLEYKVWRKSVFERDSFKCVLCGSTKSGQLNADHIKPFSLFPELRLKINNGRTLCKDCHKKTPSYMNRYMTKQNYGCL